MPTITSVSQNDWTNISNISLNIRQLLYHHTLFAQIGQRLCDLRRLAPREHRERAERLPLDLVDLAVQDVEVEFVAANRFRQDRLIDTRTGEREAQQVAAAGLQAFGH